MRTYSGVQNHPVKVNGYDQSHKELHQPKLSMSTTEMVSEMDAKKRLPAPKTDQISESTGARKRPRVLLPRLFLLLLANGR